MKYTAKDIKIIVMTNNRPKMLLETIESILKQSVKGFSCCVTDNVGVKETGDALKNFPEIEYSITDNATLAGNFINAQKHMTTPYSIIIHDDDLMHRDYIKMALEVINKEDNISLLSSCYTNFINDNVPEKYLSGAQNKQEYYLIDSQADFAMSFWDKPSCIWSGAMIKSEFYKQVDIAAFSGNYGKILDWPFMISTVKTGKAAVLADANYIFYRVHQKKDTNDDKTGISKQQVINWLSLFKNFSGVSKPMQNLYFIRAAGRAKDNFLTYTSAAVRNQTSVAEFYEELKALGLLTQPMIDYELRKKSFILSLKGFITKLLLKRDFFRTYLKIINN